MGVSLTEVINMPTLTTALAIDCEMVGGRRMRKKKVVPSRFYIVNERGECVYDTYINCEFEVDCQATRNLMASGKPRTTVKNEVKKIIKKRTLVGYDVKTVLKCIGLTHSIDKVLNESGYWLSEKPGVNGRLQMAGTNGITSSLSVYCETVTAVRWSALRDLAGRVSLVNEEGHCVYDSYINHEGIFQISDYRTSVSGLTAELMAGGRPIAIVRKEVGVLIRKLIVVGHDVVKDLKVLGLTHPEWNKMDTAEYRGFTALVNGGKPSLKLLAKEVLKMEIQQGAHSSLADAKTTMRLFRSVGNMWKDGKLIPVKNKLNPRYIATIPEKEETEPRF